MRIAASSAGQHHRERDVAAHDAPPRRWSARSSSRPSRTDRHRCPCWDAAKIERCGSRRVCGRHLRKRAAHDACACADRVRMIVVSSASVVVRTRFRARSLSCWRSCTDVAAARGAGQRSRRPIHRRAAREGRITTDVPAGTHRGSAPDVESRVRTLSSRHDTHPGNSPCSERVGTTRPRAADC